jgi:hypothetical protein
MNTGKAFSWFVPLNICNVDVNFVIFPISYEPTYPHRWLCIHCTHNSITQVCACTLEACKQPHVHAHTVHTVHLWLRRLSAFRTSVTWELKSSLSSKVCTKGLTLCSGTLGWTV